MRAGEVESETGTEQKITATQVRAWARWPSRSSEDVLLTGTHDTMINTNTLLLFHFSVLTEQVSQSINLPRQTTNQSCTKAFSFFFLTPELTESMRSTNMLVQWITNRKGSKNHGADRIYRSKTDGVFINCSQNSSLTKQNQLTKLSSQLCLSYSLQMRSQTSQTLF